MKLKQLTIHNIASIADAVIDFENGPLAENPIFLITGITGSGKTTILDSICLALYGKSPRIEKGDSARGADDELTAKDPRGLLRNGTADAFVKLLFTDNNGIDTIARWSVARANHNVTRRIQNVVRSVEAGAMKLTIFDEIDAYIEKVVGLTFAQFCKTTMLPQGEFAKFLTGKDNERAEILEKLTGTEIYREISKSIYSKTKVLKTEIELIKAKSEGVKVFNEEEISEYKNKIAEIQQKIIVVDAELKVLSDKKVWFDKAKQEQEKLERYAAEKQTASEKLAQPEVAADMLLVKDFENSSEIRALYKNREVKEVEIRGAQKNIDEDFAKAVEYKAGVANLEKDINSLAEELKRIQDNLAEDAENAEMYSNSNLIENQVKTVVDKKIQISNLRNRIAKIQSNLKKLVNDNIRESKEIKEKEASKICRIQELDQKRKDLGELNEAAVKDEKKHLETRVRQLSDLSTRCKDYNIAENALNDYKDKVKRNQADLSETETALNAAKTVFDDLQKNYAVAEELYNQTKNLCGDAAESLRQELHIGGICPVCGQKVSEVKTDVHFKKILEPVKEQLETVKVEKNAAERIMNQKQANCDSLKKTAKDLQQKDSEINNNYESVYNSYRSSDLYEEFASFEDVLSEIDKAKSLAETRISELDVILAKADACKTTMDDLNKEITGLSDALDILNRRQADFKEEKGRLETEIKSTEENICTNEKEVAILVKEIKTIVISPEWLGKFELSGIDFIRDLKKAAERYENWKTDSEQKLLLLNDKKKNIENIQQSLAELNKLYADLSNQFPEPKRVENLSLGCSNLVMHADLLQKQLNAACEEEQTLNANISAYHHAADALSADRVLELSGYTEADINQKRNTVNDLKTELSNKVALIEETNDTITRHEAVKPPMDENENLETVTGKIEELTQISKNLSAEKTTLETELKTNDERVKDLKDILAEKAKISEAYNGWKSLDKIFGAANGDTFSKIAQSYVLRDLLVYANQHLAQFTDQFSLVCKPGSLQILVKDHYNGDTLRHSNKISGGETFMISLALALGLASLNSGAVNVDTLFIDEGFGSLDEDTLSTVIDCLERLNKNNGKKVGIISHVKELRDRIFTQIQVTKPRNVSKVEVVVNN